MKKLIKAIPAAAFICGIGLCVLNSVDGYGISTNSLHSEVAAQVNGDGPGGDTTGGGTTGGGTTGGGTTGGGTSTAPDSVRAQYMYDGILKKTYKDFQTTTDANGSFKVLGIEFGEFRAHYSYDVTVIDYSCEYIPGCGNVCRYSDQKVELFSVKESKDHLSPNNP